MAEPPTGLSRHAGMRMRRGASLLLLALILAGCGLLAGPSPALDGEWRLTGGTSSGDPVPIVVGSEPTLRIAGEQASGRAACNSYGGALTVDGNRVSFSDLSQTEMGCSPDLLASEAAFMAALGQVAGATRAGDTLTLVGDAVELTFSRVPPEPDAALVGTSWILDALIQGEAVSSVPDPPPTMTIADDGTVTIRSGCRTFLGNATLTPNSMALRSALAVTGCAPGLTQAEEAISNVMDEPMSLRISGKQLTLTASDGSGLVFRAR